MLKYQNNHTTDLATFEDFILIVYVMIDDLLEMKEQGICLMALKRSNSRTDWPKSVRQLVFKLRRRVETVFSQLSGQLNAERALAKSYQGLMDPPYE